MENEYPEITAIQPYEPGETPEGYVKMPIPFVGIYQTLLGGDIDHLIDQEIEQCESEGLTCKEIKIHYDEIYKSIALYTADLLGIEGAIYAGTVCPKYYNFADDQPYLFVPEEFYNAWYDAIESCEILEFIEIELAMVVDEYYRREYNPFGDYIAQAVYAQWANGTNNGYEEISNNLEIIT